MSRTEATKGTEETEVPLELEKTKHVEYVKNLDSQLSKQSYEYWLLEHLRLNGVYWGITALNILGSPEALDREQMGEFVMSCWDEESGGFGAFPKHDAHLLSTLSALQVLLIQDQLSMLGADRRGKLVAFITGLQLPSGAFQGDRFGEVDTRFVFTAIQSLAILGELTTDIVDGAVNFILQCVNFDGAFGMVPGAESHAAQVYTCLGTLAIANRLDAINSTKLAEWLSERQVLPSGGLNGRPEKLPDSCYSWWVLSSLAIIGKTHWIDADKLDQFVLSCQDFDNGGFSDRKDNQTDVYHTCFSLAGLSLVKREKYGLNKVDPIYCLPTTVTNNIKKWPQDYV